MTLQTILVALLGAGILSYAKDLIKWIWKNHKASQPEQIQARKVHEGVAQADESLIVVAKARDELQQDNERLRGEITEMYARHTSERQEWTIERSTLRKEMDALEDRLRVALTELHDLRVRHGMTGPPDAVPAN